MVKYGISGSENNQSGLRTFKYLNYKALQLLEKARFLEQRIRRYLPLVDTGKRSLFLWGINQYDDLAKVWVDAQINVLDFQLAWRNKSGTMISCREGRCTQLNTDDKKPLYRRRLPCRILIIFNKPYIPWLIDSKHMVKPHSVSLTIGLYSLPWNCPSSSRGFLSFSFALLIKKRWYNVIDFLTVQRSESKWNSMEKRSKYWNFWTKQYVVWNCLRWRHPPSEDNRY